MENRRTFLTAAFCVVCMVILIGSCNADTSKDGDSPRVLTFSEMNVKTETKEGFFGGRYVTFEITGKATNYADKYVLGDDFPYVVWDDGKQRAETNPGKVEHDETCDVTWKKEFRIKDNTAPELTFSCEHGKVEFTGLDECQAELNKQVKEIADNYASEDAKKEAEKEAKNKLTPSMENFIEKYNAASSSELKDIKKSSDISFSCDASGRAIIVSCPDDMKHYSVSVIMDKTLGLSWIKYVVHDFAAAFDPDSADALEQAWYKAGMNERDATEDLTEKIGAMTLFVNYDYYGIKEVDISWDDPNNAS